MAKQNNEYMFYKIKTLEGIEAIRLRAGMYHSFGKEM